MRRLSRFLLDRRAAVTVTALAVVVPAGSASAETRYAANYVFTNNAGTAPCTDPAKPCTLTGALASAVSGDEVLLPSTVIRAPGLIGLGTLSPKAEGRALPGSVSTANQPAWSNTLEVPAGVTLRGTDPAKLPVIVVAPNSQAEAGVELGKNAKIRDVAINGKAADNAAITYSLSLGESALADRVRVTTTASTGVLQIGVSMTNGAVLRSSVSRGTGSGLGAASRVVAVSASSPNATTTVRNVTAISTTDGGEGIASGTSSGTSVITISNTIARGTASDIKVRAGLAGGKATANVDHSNWISQDVGVNPGATGATAVLQQTGGNQNGGTAAEPNFFDAAAGDYRQMPGSPTINAGVVDVNNGALAFGGALRKIGLTTDIGADEFDPAAVPATPLPAPVEPDPDPAPPESTPPAPTTPAPPPPDTAKPVLSGLALGKKSFKRSKGTTISFTLSEAAKVKLDFGQPKTGRLVAAKCVKPSAKNRKKPKCTQANLRGSLTIDGKAGLNTLTFKGQLPTKKLAFGSYLLTATATDPAGNVGTPTTKRLTLKK